jgi:hypothetical protein
MASVPARGKRRLLARRQEERLRAERAQPDRALCCCAKLKPRARPHYDALMPALLSLLVRQGILRRVPPTRWLPARCRRADLAAGRWPPPARPPARAGRHAPDSAAANAVLPAVVSTERCRVDRIRGARAHRPSGGRRRAREARAPLSLGRRRQKQSARAGPPAALPGVLADHGAGGGHRRPGHRAPAQRAAHAGQLRPAQRARRPPGPARPDRHLLRRV